jgi:enoyl-[acyl-carrier protein] reductase I
MMALLEGKNALVFGVANDHSIAWGIARTFKSHGASLAFSYSAETLERRVRPLAESVGSDFVEKCDVTRDDEIDALFKKAERELGTIDILVHSIAFAAREDLQGDFHRTSREGFRLTLDISAYSLIALTRAALPLMPHGGSIISLTYNAGDRVAPNYNVMGVAKAALEASTRYLAADLGPRGIRVNAISAGPIRTLSAAGVSGFKKMYRHFASVAPLQQNISIDDIGNAALWLASDLSSKTTGEILFVDCGFNILGVPMVPDEKNAS